MEIQVTGSTLTPEKIIKVPAAVTVFTHDELRRLGLDSLNELMNLVPGFQSYRSSTAPFSYAASSRARRIGYSAAEILILIDGQRLNSPRDSGSTTILTNLPLMNIEQVEFIRGPGAAIYGSNAMMGIINIVTRTNANEVSISYGQSDRKQIYLLASDNIGELSFDLFTHFEKDQGEQYTLPDTFSSELIQTNDPKEVFDFNLKLAWQNTQVNVQHKEYESRDFYQLGTLSNNFNRGDVELSSLSLKQDFNWFAVSSYAWLSYYQTSSGISSQLTAPGELFLASGGASNEALFIRADFDNYSENRLLWHNDWYINQYSSLQFGVEFRHTNAPETVAKNNFDLGDLSNSNFPIAYYGSLQATTPVQAKSSRDILGVYAQYQQSLFESSHFTLGLRYDDFSEIGSQLTPRFAWVQEINENHSIKFLYGEAFRAPAEDELNLQNNPLLLGNPDLIPESVKSQEYIWLSQWSNTSASVGYFENRFEHSIVQISVDGGTRQYKNIEQQPIKGIEVELSHQFNQHFLVRATYTHINEKSTLSYREADQLASLMVNYHYENWNINLISSYHGVREMPTGGSEEIRIKLDAYWQLFAKLKYKFNSDWQGFIQVKNLSDEHYSTPAVSTHLDNGIPNRSREFLLGLVWHY